MYSVDERDRVIELKNVPQSSIGAPMPVVLSDETIILLAYFIQEKPSNQMGSLVHTASTTISESLALIEFNSYCSFMFGAPNDEAFSGHPLESRGLHPYGAFEIENSSWIRQLERMNSVHPNHNPENFARFKHLVFAFHDSTFECVAKSFAISKHEGSMESLMPTMQSRFRW